MRPRRPGSNPRWLPRSNSRSGRARANCASPSTSGSGPTSGRRMSCASENVHVNSNPFGPDRQTERIFVFAFMYGGRAIFWPDTSCKERDKMLQPGKDEEVLDRPAEAASAIEQGLQVGRESIPDR